MKRLDKCNISFLISITEWTIVQLTTQFNIKESMQQDLSKMYTNPLHITVFNCGQTTLKPFCINVSAPKDINGETIELCQEMHSIVTENKNLLYNCFGSMPIIEKVTVKQKKVYNDHRNALNNRLKVSAPSFFFFYRY